ncbi:unnamed protein product [Triticum turgidum subsp. durum]|uniref:Uncharacterized protein n=1 Tax=Triticum turgidum subsp. durum TaxID=4567 RepID=A0A9R1QU19_TRITD|nr:unnamed protein product [Triticum turgidum subsp. durum]
MLMEMGLISFSAVEMAVPIRSRASSIFLTNAYNLWNKIRAWIGLVLCMSRGGRKEELALGSTTTAGKSMSRHAGSQRNAPPSRTRPPPHSRHGAVAPPCHKGRLPQLRCRALPAAPCPWTPVAVGAAADGRGRRGTPPPTTKAEPAASCAAAAAATRWRRGTTPPVDIG